MIDTDIRQEIITIVDSAITERMRNYQPQSNQTSQVPTELLERIVRLEERIQHMQEDMNRRFQDIDKRFDRLSTGVGIGFAFVSALITIFKFWGIH